MNKDERKKLAIIHHEEMLELNNDVPITIYDTSFKFSDFGEREYDIHLSVTDNDTVSEIFEDHKEGYSNPIITVLNFASFTRPGGGFLNGSNAQEENLCMRSNLYEILEQQTEFYKFNADNAFKTKGAYMNRAIFSEKVTFFKGDESKQCNVITCACPNKSVKYLQDHPTENYSILKSRIRFILDIAEHNLTDTLILGAWGCGVFKQDPQEVATIFKEVLQDKKYQFTNVIFAIPAGENYNKFKEVFK